MLHIVTKQKLALLLLMIPCWANARPVSAQETWDYSPYRIRIWLAFQESPQMSDRMRSDIARFLKQRARIYAGATWKVAVSPAPNKVAAEMLRQIDQITVDQIKESWINWDPEDAAEAKFAPTGDKLMLLAIREDLGGVSIQARELDCRTRYWGPVVHRQVGQVRRTAREAFSAIATAFAPIARIERVDGKEGQARIRAGGLIHGAKDSPVDIRPGDPLLPINRRNDREGLPLKKGIQIIPWTYFFVTAQDGSNLTCQVHTGIRSPMRGRSTSRTLRIGLGVRPVHKTTLLQLQSTDETPQTLTGYDIYSKDPKLKPPPPDAPKVMPPYFGRTDWRGAVEIPKGDVKLRIVYVKNGNNLLARLPIVPGLEATQVAEMRNDDPRLMAEEFNRQVQSKIVELVTARRLIEARIEARIKGQKMDEARQLFEQLTALETREDIEAMLSGMEERVQAELAVFPNRATNAKVEQLFQRTRVMSQSFLDNALIKGLQDKLGGVSPQ